MIKYCKISVVVCCTYPYNFTGIEKKSEKSGQKPKKRARYFSVNSIFGGLPCRIMT